MGACHGRRRCTLAADAATFGNPCRPQTRMYLKAVYTCVPRKVLKESLESEPDEDELAADDNDDDFDYDKGEFFRESAFISPSPNQEKGRDRVEPEAPPSGEGVAEGAGHGRANTGGLDNLHVYVAMSVAAALLLLTGLALGRLLAQRRPGPARPAPQTAADSGQTLPHLAVTETAIDLAGGGEPLFGPKAAAALQRWQQTDVDAAVVAVPLPPLDLDRGDGGGQFFGR